MSSKDWSFLPSVVIVEILSLLCPNDRLNASSVCKSWRKCLFYACSTQKNKSNDDFALKVNVQSVEDSLLAKYVAETFGRIARKASVQFESTVPSIVQSVAHILEVLSKNRNLCCIKICPASGRLEHRERSIINRYVDALETLIRSSRNLEVLAFGCVEEILDNAEEFLRILSQRHESSLRCIYLASVKEDPERYAMLNIAPSAFERFSRLQRLSLDYDYVGDELLECLSRPEHVPLLSLDVHVHMVTREHRRISDVAWQRMCAHSPDLEVSLTVLHSAVAANSLLSILQPSMPLTHFAQYFCSSYNNHLVEAVDFIAETYSRRFRSICIVEYIDDFRAGFYEAPEEDPFVMLAWRCENLTDFTLIGYSIAFYDLIAIARLRGHQLRTLKVPKCCIDFLNERTSVTSNYEQVVREISRLLDQPWSPIPNSQLHSSLVDWETDAVSLYMPSLLARQTW